MTAENYFKKHIKEGQIYRYEGCNNEEIQEIESFYKYPLPKAYTDFLRVAGREFISYDQIRWGWDNRKFTKKEIEDSIKFSGKTIEVKDSYVFFYMEEGGSDFGFFELNEGENPPVYWYSIIQAESRFCQMANSFTEFIDLLIDENNPLPKVHTDDLVLYKNILRRNKELAPFDENNLSFFDKVQISEMIFDRINHEYEGLEQELATKMLLDLAKEKAKYLFKKPDFLFEILEKLKGDFKNLSSFYFECIIDHIDKNPIHILFPNKVYSDDNEYLKIIRDSLENQEEEDIEDLPF